MSVGWDFIWCPVSRITTPLARKRPFHWISMKIRLVRAAKETSKFQNWLHPFSSRRRYMKYCRYGVKTIKSINQFFYKAGSSIDLFFPKRVDYFSSHEKHNENWHCDKLKKSFKNITNTFACDLDGIYCYHEWNMYFTLCSNFCIIFFLFECQN